MDLKDKKVLVIGTGLSGIGSAELLVKKGAHVLLLEQNEKADRETIKKKFQETLTEEETRCSSGFPPAHQNEGSRSACPVRDRTGLAL